MRGTIVAAGMTLALAASVIVSAVAAQAPAATTVAQSTANKKKPADDRNAPVTIDADQMESFRKEALVVFTGNVVARQNDSIQYADRVEVYLDEKGERVLRTVSTGNVKIVTRDCRIGTAKRSEYYDAEQRMELIGNARVWEGDNVVTGEKITIFLSQERSVVQGGRGERVKAVFVPKDEKQKATEKAEKAKEAPAPCAS